MRIGIDIMGGDHAPEKIVQGVLLAKEEIKDKTELVLFGDKKKIENLLYISEYKRRQSAPGVKVSQKNFGRDRRYPITNLFRDKN